MVTSETPLVSAILITYNSAQYVKEALESIKSQTWKNIELIVSDDGSTDQTVPICSRWLKENKDRFPISKLLSVSHNSGIPSNCNRGIIVSTGVWVKIVSGDDILLENAFADNMAYVQQFPDASFIASDVCEIDENSTIIRDRVINEGLNFITSTSSVKKQIKRYSRWPAYLNTPTFFFKKEAIAKVDYFDEKFKIYEDIPMVIKLLKGGFPLHYLKKTTLAYRIHENAASRSTQLHLIREKEALMVFKKYQRKQLNKFNPFDLAVFFEYWLRFNYSGVCGRRGGSILRKLSPFYWYMRMNGVKNY